MKKEPTTVKYVPDIDQCLRCVHGEQSLRRQCLPDLDPENEHCFSLPFAFMPPAKRSTDELADVTCTLFERKDNFNL